MSSTQVALRCVVSGRVQGVFFRASTARKARELGVVGHALNLDDGTVEVLAIGPQARVDALCAWLKIGPPAACVERVAMAAVKAPEPLPTTFSTR